MTGSTPFLIEKYTNFERSFKKLVKTYKSKYQKQEFIRVISEHLEKLIINPLLTLIRNHKAMKFYQKVLNYLMSVSFISWF